MIGLPVFTTPALFLATVLVSWLVCRDIPAGSTQRRMRLQGSLLLFMSVAFVVVRMLYLDFIAFYFQPVKTLIFAVVFNIVVTACLLLCLRVIGRWSKQVDSVSVVSQFERRIAFYVTFTLTFFYTLSWPIQLTLGALYYLGSLQNSYFTPALPRYDTYELALITFILAGTGRHLLKQPKTEEGG